MEEAIKQLQQTVINQQKQIDDLIIGRKKITEYMESASRLIDNILETIKLLKIAQE
jgi:hypothetical protein